MTDDTIWTAKLDEVFDVAVKRVDGSRGHLTISRDGKVLSQRDVTLSYGAAFGPDVGDVAEWEEWAVEYVDGHHDG
jgi:hypothetical protein